MPHPRVVADPHRESGRLLAFGALRHSYVDLADPTYLHFSYTQAIAAVLDTFRPPGHPITALHLGAGGLTIPRYLAHTRAGSRSLVAEIDPQVLQLAHNQLGFNDNTHTGNGITTTIGDARTITAQQPDNTHHAVIGDAFDAVSVPLHLLTVQFLAEIRRVLAPEGVYVLNLIDAPPLTLLRSALATVSSRFVHTIVAARPGNVAGVLRGNFVIAGCDSPLPVQALEQRLSRCDPPQTLVTEPAHIHALVSDAPVLTDELVAAGIRR